MVTSDVYESAGLGGGGVLRGGGDAGSGRSGGRSSGAVSFRRSCRRLAADDERAAPRRPSPGQRRDLRRGDLDGGAGPPTGAASAAAAVAGLSPDDARGRAAEDAVGLVVVVFLFGG